VECTKVQISAISLQKFNGYLCAGNEEYRVPGLNSTAWCKLSKIYQWFFEWSMSHMFVS